MTAMVGARRAVLFGGTRGFPLRGGGALAARDIDLRNNRYWQGATLPAVTDMLTTARSSTHLLANASGVYQSFGNNVLARNTGVGAYIGMSLSNICANYNAAPQLTNVAKEGDANAVLTIVDQSTELNSAGFGNICNGNAYKLDNSLGSTNAWALIAGTQSNTIDKCTQMVVAWGSGQFFTQVNAGGGGGSIGNTTLTSVPTLYSGIPSVATAIAGMRVCARPGAILYFVLNQYGVASFAAPPIITNGSSATRLASDVTAANMAWFTPLDGIGATEIIVPKWNHVGDGVDRPLFQYIKDASNYIRGYVNASGYPALKIVTGGTTQTDTALTTAITTGRKPLTFGWSPAGGYIGDAAGNVATFGAVSLPGGITNERVGSSQAGNYLNDILERRATLAAISQAQALALAATV